MPATPLEDLKKKLLSLLTEEGFDNELELQEAIIIKTAALQNLVSKGKEASKSAQELKAALERLSVIDNLVQHIQQLATQMQEDVDAEVPLEPLTENPIQGTVESSLPPTEKDRMTVIMERPKLLLPEKKATALMRSQSTDERESIEVAFYHALSVIPECAEKSLSMLYGHFQNEMKKKLETDSVLLSTEEVVRVFAHLKDQLTQEGLDGALIAEILERIEPELCSGNIQKLSAEFWKLLKEIQPLDMELMLTLIDKTAVAGERIQGQDIILLLGGTGTGKSTTIHWLAGSEMQKTMVAGLKHIAPVKTLQSELESFITSPFTRSETRSINAVTISYSAVGSKAPGSVVLCDSPGFGDTDGAEIDIANGIGVVKAVRACRSVKPLILISAQSIGDRLQGISKLSRILVMFIGSIQQELPAFSYAFTKYYKEQEDEIHPLLDHKLKHLPDNELTDVAFVALLEDIVNKTSKGARVLDPIKDKPGEFLDSLAATPAITNPQEVFRDFVTPESLDRLKEQLSKHQMSVHAALKRSDVQLLKYKLDQLSKLNNSLTIYESKKVYEDCVREIVSFIQDLMAQAFQRIAQILLDGNTSVTEDLKAVSAIMLGAMVFEPVRKIHFADQITDLEDTFVTKIEGVQTDLLKRIKLDNASEVTTELGSQLAAFDVVLMNVSLAAVRLDKMQSMVEIFADTAAEKVTQLKASYQEASDYLSSIFDQCAEVAKKTIGVNTLNVYVSIMDQLKLMVEQFGAHLNVEKMQIVYQRSQQGLVDYLNGQVHSVTALFTNTDVTVEIIDAVHYEEIFALLLAAERAEGLWRHVSADVVTGLQSTLLQQTLGYIAKVSNQITALCTAEQIDFVTLKSLMDLVDKIRVQPEVAYQSTQIYQEMTDAIRRVIQGLKEQAIRNASILANLQPVDYLKLSECLSSLKASSNFVDHVSGVYSNEFDQIAGMLEQHCLKISKEIGESTLSVEQHAAVTTVYYWVRQLMGLTQCRDTLTNIDVLAQSTQEEVSKKIIATLQVISPLLQLDRQVAFTEIKNAFSYLTACKEIDLPVVREQLNYVESATQERATDYFVMVAAQLSAAFKIIEKQGLGLESSAISEHVQQLLIQLQGLSQLVGFHDRNPMEQVPLYRSLFEVLPVQLLQEWCATEGHLSRYLSGLKEGLDEAAPVDHWYAKLKVVRALMSLDRFLPDSQKYGELSLTLEGMIHQWNNSVISEIKLAARSGRYQELKEGVQKLDLSIPDMASAFEEIKKELSDSLLTSAKELNTELTALKLEDVRLFNDVIKRIHQLRQALLYVADYVVEESKQRLIQGLSIIEQAMYVQVVEFAEPIDRWIERNQFHAVEERLQQVQQMAAGFGEISLRNSEGIQFKCQDQLLILVADKKQQIATQLTMAIQKYDPLDLSQFSKEPPIELFKQLQLAAPDDPAYSAACKQLSDLIQKQIVEFLEQAKTAETIELAEIQVLLIESVHPYLPVEVYGAFDQVLQECKMHIEMAKEKYQRELDEDAVAGALRKMVDRLVHYAQKGAYRYTYDAKVKIKSLITNGAVRFKADLAKSDLVTVFENLPKAWNDWVYYSTCLGGLKPPSDPRYFERYKDLYQDEQCLQICIEMIALVVATLHTALLQIEQTAEGFPDTLKQIGVHFDVLPAFLELKKSAPSFYQDLLGKDSTLETQVKQGFIKVQHCFSGNQSIFEQHLKSGALSELKRVMDVAQEGDALMVSAKSYALTTLCQEETSDFKPALSSCFSYKEMREAFARELLRLRESVSQTFLYHERTKTANASDRDAFYTELSAQYGQLKQAKLLAAHVASSITDVNILEAELSAHITQEIGKVADAVNRLLDSIPTDEVKIYSEFNVWFDNLRSIAESFQEPAMAQIAVGRKADIDRSFNLKIRALRDEAWREEDSEKIVDLLIKMKSITIKIPAYKKAVDETIDGLLLDYKKRPEGAQKIGMLGLALNAHPNQGVSQMIIAEHDSFKGYALSLRNEKTLRFTIDDVIKGLRGDDINKTELLEQYKKFDQEYWSLVEKGLLDPQQAALEIIKNARLIASSGGGKDKIRNLMAHVFAYWTLDNSKHFAEATGSGQSGSKAEKSESGISTRKNYLMQPHAAQVVSIFRLLGIEGLAAGSGTIKKIASSIVSLFTGSSTNEASKIQLTNHLVQIGTGEGKSVTLAVTAAVLALLGCEVNCACYSQYLSRRDYEAFQSVFRAFGVAELVHYGTFNKLCEDFINHSGDVRALVEATVSGRGGDGARQTSVVRPQILLIDEVDVFFNKDFYGNMYRPLARLKDPTITALINYIWRNKENAAALGLRSIQGTAEYQACSARFGEWTFLVEESVKAMLGDLRSFESLEHVVLNDRIGYKEQDGISFEVNYGYKTLFAYYQAHEAGKLSRASLESMICLSVDCGSFSYAEMPKKYQCVMGVTGTLETLSAPEKLLLQEVYNIHRSTFMPSVYGANQLVFAGDSSHDLQVESQAGHFIAIRNEINTRLESLNGSGVKRAVLIFFESTAKLMAFYRSRELHDIQDQVKLMTEEVTAVEKEGLIRQAVTSGSVTLLSREFGRGTDFICYDDRLIASGGVHVIQTFVSDELSEETQIKGRTARQGNKGSFSMVLLGGELENFGIRATEMDSMKLTGKRYSMINELRCRFFEKQYPESMRYVDDIKRDHLAAEAFLKVLLAQQQAEIKAFLLERNKAVLMAGPAGTNGKTSRTICLMDATGSMSGLLEKSKHTVKTMFERAYEVLQAKNNHAILELQFVVYRNYDCSIDDLLQVSPWETKPENLRTFMDKISAHGGTHLEEAIEIGLSHANLEAEDGGLSQVILIGDAPPNTQSQVAAGRGRKGDAHWAGTKFAAPTYYDTEITRLKEKNIAVHAFFVASNAEKSFKEIAQKTGGRCESLDINSEAGAQVLVDLVTEQLLRNVGGDVLVDEYRARFCGRGYLSSTIVNGQTLFNPVAETSQLENPNAVNTFKK